MQFQPITKEEWENEGSFLGEGLAEFKIMNVIDGKSSKGNPMLTIEFSAVQGSIQGTVKDFITPNAKWKIITLCKAIGDPKLIEQAKEGHIEDISLLNKKGEFMLKRKPSQNDPEKKYLNVDKYLPKLEGKPEVVDDDLPF